MSNTPTATAVDNHARQIIQAWRDGLGWPTRRLTPEALNGPEPHEVGAANEGHKDEPEVAAAESVNDASANASDIETLVGSEDEENSQELTLEDGSIDGEGSGDDRVQVVADDTGDVHDGAGGEANEDKDHVEEDGTDDGKSNINDEEDSAASSVQKEEILAYLGDCLGGDVDSEDDDSSSVASANADGYTADIDSEDELDTISADIESAYLRPAIQTFLDEMKKQEQAQKNARRVDLDKVDRRPEVDHAPAAPQQQSVRQPDSGISPVVGSSLTKQTNDTTEAVPSTVAGRASVHAQLDDAEPSALSTAEHSHAAPVRNLKRKQGTETMRASKKQREF